MTSELRVRSAPEPTRFRGQALRAVLALATLALALLAFAPAAHASKQAIDFFGGAGTLGGEFTQPQGVAVNDSGAGPADAGDLYAIDSRCCQPPQDQSGNRIHRFGRDDNGTPADTADDAYFFISTWGAGVLSGGTDYEICDVQAACQAAVASAGNGTPAGNGTLDFSDIVSGALAVDPDTGNVFVTDQGNNRVNVYDGVGAFLYSFGFDVTASGPGDTGTGYEVCVAAADDVCKAGLSGPGVGQIGSGRGIAVSAPDGTPATATVFVADSGNNRVNTYGLDGSGPGSIGSAAEFNSGHPQHVAVDSRGILYASNSKNSNQLERYDTQGVNGPVGFLAPIAAGVNERQEMTVSATAGTFHLTFDPDGAGPAPAETTVALSFNAPAQGSGSVLSALRALPSFQGATGTAFVSGGPGDATGSNPYTITFVASLGAKDVPQLTCADGAPPLSGGAGCSVSTSVPGQAGLIPGGPTGSLHLDPDSDGGGADTDVLYVARSSVIQQFGPLNEPGLTAPPAAEDDRHNTNGITGSLGGLAVEPATGRLYAASSGVAGRGVYVLDEASPTPPTASLDSIDAITPTSADLHATIDPNGPPATRYRFEYVDDATFQASGFDNAKSTPEVLLGAQEDPQAVEEILNPLPIGLDPNTTYHVRVLAERKFATPVISNELTFTTAAPPPLVETAGAPVRTTTTAQLNGRVTPLGSATSYHFEYGTAGPCSANSCASTAAVGAGSGQLTQLVSAEITGLQPDTTYHYRLIADNGVGGPQAGEDMTVRSRASDALPDQNDRSRFPGPPGSDRAWEQVSIADSSGNPVSVFTFQDFSDDGNRALYGIAGGTASSSTGTAFNPHVAERTPVGWQNRSIYPSRDQLVGQFWGNIQVSDDLSVLLSLNIGNETGVNTAAAWLLGLNLSPAEFYRRSGTFPSYPLGLSGDGSRALAILDGAPDPAHPSAGGLNVYDIGADPPRLVSLLPGDLVGPCPTSANPAGSSSAGQAGSDWISRDGSLVFFLTRPQAPCEGSGGPAVQLYVRDLLAGQTKLVSGPPVSGPEAGGDLIALHSDAAFLASQSRLAPEDAADGSNDVYRYDLSDDSLDCLTCVIPGFSTDVRGDDSEDIAVAEDGSRLYFTTTHRLLPGAQPEGQPGIYRLDLSGGDLAFVAARGRVGGVSNDTALSDDGRVLVFESDAAALNPLGGVSDNGGGLQVYRYDDADRSLVCASCPQDGAAPFASVPEDQLQTPLVSRARNRTNLAADGSTLAFATPTALLGPDQNTTETGEDPARGIDVYEWRDGRLALITDGLTKWPKDFSSSGGVVFHPRVSGVGPDGRNVYFTATARYTPDAPDALLRLYTARIGGGFDFPPEGLPPCDLASGACEGPASRAQDFSGAGTAAFEGSTDPRDPFPRDCSAASRRAAKLSRLARALRKRSRAANPGRAKALRRKGAKVSRKARKASRNARNCRRANRRDAR